jgi:hypothetical protein
MDAIVAHELAHFRQWRRALRFVFLLIMVAILLSAAAVDQRLQIWALLPVSVCVLLQRAWKRRLEFAADRFSAQLTGTPEAMAASLVKLDSLNGVPIRGSRLHELFLSHPWTERRLQRLGVGLETAQSSPSVPAYAIDSEEAFSNRPVAVLLQALAKYGPFLHLRIWAISLAAGGCAWVLHASAMTCGLVLIAAVTIGFVALSKLWSRRVAHADGEVRASLVKLHGFDWPESPLWGLSPGEGRTIFDSGYDWDMGLVQLSQEALCYAGDRASFALPRAAVGHIELRPGPPIQWRRGKVICIRIKSGTPECITLRRLSIGNNAGFPALPESFNSLQQWVEGGRAEPRPGCGLPSFDSVTWPKRRTASERVLPVRDFLRSVVAAVVPAWLTSSIILGLGHDSANGLTAGGGFRADFPVPGACSSS